MNSITIDQNLYRGIENYAIEHNTSIREVIEKCLTKWLGKTAKAESPTRKRLMERIQHIRSLKDNWDNQNAPRISTDICNQASRLIQQCSDSELNGLAIFPNTSDGIFMQWRTDMGHACLAITTDSCYYDVTAQGSHKTGELANNELSTFRNILKNIM